MTDNFIKPLEKRRSLTAELIRQLREQILSGKLVPGQQLPTEQALVASADVSRTVVREAVAALKADGLVITRQGVGAFVAANAGAEHFRIRPEEMATFEEIINVLELRMAVEVEMAGAAAKRRTEDDLDVINKYLDQMTEDINAGRDASGSDYQLHNAIAKAAKNPHFERFLSFLGRHLVPPPHDLLMKYGADETVEGAAQRQLEFLRLIHNEHKEMVAAITNSDEAAARDATRRHLANSIERHRKVLSEKTTKK